MTRIQDFVNINTLLTPAPLPGIETGILKISTALNQVLHVKSYHSLNSLKNTFFKKQDFTRLFLSDSEIDTVNRFKAKKKQLEWMAGRLLVKRMVQAGHAPEKSLQEIQISHHEKGAPFLVNSPGIKISISHSDDYAAAAVCSDKNQDIGIDIEKIGSLPDTSFLNLAFTEKEINTMALTPCDIFKKWTVKEAYLKYIKLGFNESLHRVEIIDDTILYHGQKVRVSVFSTIIHSNYAVSLITGPAC
ncbi:MAG: 4'-phosphopantetheinyl transferase superfamily protein [Thermodesulfobacteriota bacterium]|nr:4'-phosphopantetheinyl transferase superfamily protein [Thermodesulfobacteriota bacterium]